MDLRLTHEKAALRQAKGDETSHEGLGTRIARRFAGNGLTCELPELRGQPARPAELDG